MSKHGARQGHHSLHHNSRCHLAVGVRDLGVAVNVLLGRLRSAHARSRMQHNAGARTLGNPEPLHGQPKRMQTLRNPRRKSSGSLRPYARCHTCSRSLYGFSQLGMQLAAPCTASNAKYLQRARSRQRE